MSVVISKVFAPSENIVAREIGVELFLIPLVAGMGDLEDDLFVLNRTGAAIWRHLDGQKSLQEIIGELTAEFEAAPGEIERDVAGLIKELEQRGMVLAVEPAGKQN